MSEEIRNGRYEEDEKICWYKDGKLHREDDPAIEFYDGDKEWFMDGLKHREIGPAIEYDGYKAWYQNDVLHREDGPAREWSNGGNEWYKDGKLHREDGPAIEYPDGDKEWWLGGVKYTEEEFNHWLSKKQLKERLAQQLEEKPTGKRVKI